MPCLKVCVRNLRNFETSLKQRLHPELGLRRPDNVDVLPKRTSYPTHTRWQLHHELQFSVKNIDKCFPVLMRDCIFLILQYLSQLFFLAPRAVRPNSPVTVEQKRDQ